VSAGSVAQLVPLEKGEVQATLTKTTPAEPDGYTPTELASLTSGCYTPASCDLNDATCESTLNLAFNATSAVCAVSDMAVTTADDFALFAGIRSNGCSSGELRVGLMDPAAPEELINRGRGQRNPTYRGVATRGSRCSSNLTEACDTLKEEVLAGTAGMSDLADVCGVSHPELAATGTHGLVAYLGASAAATDCGSTTPVLDSVSASI
jgi:hypothetical protein